MRKITDSTGKWIMLGSGALCVVLLGVCVSVMLFDDADKEIRNLLGTMSKIETLKIIGAVMSGAGLVFGFAFKMQERFAKAQVKSAAQVQERIKVAIKNLGDVDSSVRIAAFYEFVHLMKDNGKKYRKNILDILYSQVPTGPGTKGDEKSMYPPEKPAKDVQVLLNILFKSQDINRSDIKPNLQEVYSSGPNLNSTYLCKADLRGADLRGVNLSGACLIEIDLSGADLSGAGLSGADLRRADLSGAKLHGADLSGVHLLEAKLSGAKLFGVDLGSVDLSDADLLKAQLGGASYTNRTIFPKWLDLPPLPNDGDKVKFPAGFIAREKPKSGG